MRYIFAFVVAVAGLIWVSWAPPPSTYSQSTVMITSGQGHGSAVHIGGGYFVTAAHVTSGAKEVRWAASSGLNDTADVLWESKEYDIAIVKSKLDYSGLPMANLECRTPVHGEELEFAGNPMYLKNASSWGKVAGAAMEIPGTWKSVVPVDASIVPGQSGGAVYDSDGDVVGINVGVAVYPMGFGSSLTGFGFIVPSSVVCDLLAINR